MQPTLVLLALSLNLVVFIADPNAADGACPSPEHPDWTTECPDGKCGPPGWLCCPSFKKRCPPGFVFECLNSVNCHKTEADANKACNGAYEMCAPGRESGSVGSPPATAPITGPGSHSTTDLAIRPVDVKGWAGTWNEKGGEKDTFCDALNKFEDVQLKKWVAGNMEINRFREDDFSPMTAFGSTLRVKNSFFSQQPARKTNLTAWEGAKVVWNIIKDKQISTDHTFGKWFIGYYPQHEFAMEEMRDAKLKNTNDSLGHLNEADEAARFTDVFRAQALPLVKPEDPDDAKEWDQIARNSNRYVRPLLKKK